MRGMTQLYVWHDSVIRVTVWRDAFIRVPWQAGAGTTPSHVTGRHVTHMNESCHTYEWVMSHAWMSHVTHMNKSRHTRDGLIHTCGMTHSYVCHEVGFTCHDSVIRVTWLIHLLVRMCDMMRALRLSHMHMEKSSRTEVAFTRHNSFICVPWLIHICDMTHSFLFHDRLKQRRLPHVCEKHGGPIHMCAMTHSYTCHDPIIPVTAWHYSFARVPWQAGAATTLSHVADYTSTNPWLYSMLTAMLTSMLTSSRQKISGDRPRRCVCVCVCVCAIDVVEVCERRVWGVWDMRLDQQCLEFHYSLRIYTHICIHINNSVSG